PKLRQLGSGDSLSLTEVQDHVNDFLGLYNEAVRAPSGQQHIWLTSWSVVLVEIKEMAFVIEK
ncbi:hypothetical protein, partial [Neisseria meningitidis]|uniref:hypothetical protein n=1 Tax=Neisseria meningitidis TaxID=487 RepID=UPI001C58F6A2